jgi:hypothetical protein
LVSSCFFSTVLLAVFCGITSVIPAAISVTLDVAHHLCW